MHSLLAFAFAAAAVALDPLSIEVSAEKGDRRHTPVVFTLPQEFSSAKGVTLRDVETKQLIPCQLEPGDAPRLHWMLTELPAGATRRYEIAEAGESDAASAENVVTATKSERDLLLSVGAKPVLRYQHAVMPSDDASKPFYRRSGFIHPLYDPQGRELTEAMPPDHMHQHGIMFAWVNSEHAGRKIDFWNSHKEEGAVRHATLDATASGPVFASFTARLEHLDLKASDSPQVVLNETWNVRVYNRADGFLIDWKSTLSCAGDKPLKLNKNDYGGLCVRGNPAWLDPNVGEFLTSEGKTRRDGNHTRPYWVDLGGPLAGSSSGVAVFDSPHNFRHPQPVRLHPTMPYFSYSPVVLGPFSIEPGQPYVSQYRFFAHSGKPDAKMLEALWQDYASPPTVGVVK